MPAPARNRGHRLAAYARCSTDMWEVDVTDRMAEAEVSLRLAFWLAASGRTTGESRVAIDGAQVKTKDAVHFDVPLFMGEAGWAKCGSSQTWQGTYRRADLVAGIAIHSSPGMGDVVAQLEFGRT